MKQELDAKLVEDFPNIFRERRWCVTESCMAWGMTCGDGWYTIIRALCGNIESHIKWERERRLNLLRYNRRLKKAIEQNDINVMLSTWQSVPPPDWAVSEAKDAMAMSQYKEVPKKIKPVVAKQVKEKFGTLRFYYEGGDDYVAGLVRMAESMSAVTCEGCGVPATTDNHDGWIGTICTSCKEERKKRREQYE